MVTGRSWPIPSAPAEHCRCWAHNRIKFLLAEDLRSAVAPKGPDLTTGPPDEADTSRLPLGVRCTRAPCVLLATGTTGASAPRGGAEAPHDREEVRWTIRDQRRWPWSTRCVSASPAARPRCSPSTAASTCSGMQTLRRSLRAAGGDYKIYKNTLVRFAVRELGLEIEDLLTGPTAIAFVPSEGSRRSRHGGQGASRLRQGQSPISSSKAGVLGENILSEADAKRSGRHRPSRRTARPTGRPHGCADAAIRRPAPGRAA